MKTGDLVWDVYERNFAIIVSKITNINFVCFIPRTGKFLKIRRKHLKQLTPKFKYKEETW